MRVQPLFLDATAAAAICGGPGRAKAVAASRGRAVELLSPLTCLTSSYCCSVKCAFTALEVARHVQRSRAASTHHNDFFATQLRRDRLTKGCSIFHVREGAAPTTVSEGGSCKRSGFHRALPPWVILFTINTQSIAHVGT